MKDEEQEAIDNMPESLQESDKGLDSQEALDNLDTAFEAMEEAFEAVNEGLRG